MRPVAGANGHGNARPVVGDGEVCQLMLAGENTSAREVDHEPMSRRGMITPSRDSPDSSSQRTAMRWAAFLLEMPQKRGSHGGRIWCNRIRQMPAMA